jgi:hypothetical protein
MNHMLVSLKILSALASQNSPKLPDDVALRVEKSDISLLITELSKAKSIDREGLNILRKKTILKAHLDKLASYRNSLGADEKIEAIRKKLKDPIISMELKKALFEYEGAEKENQYKLFLTKYSLTDELVAAVHSLDMKIEKAESQIAKTNEVNDSLNAEMLKHRSKPDTVSLLRPSPIEPLEIDPDVTKIFKEAGEIKVNVLTESKVGISSIKLAERFAK